MRQARELLNGKWTGNQHGGVKAPETVMLPDPATRFARTAARLEALSAGHPMADWLSLMTRLASAQHLVAGMMGPVDCAVRMPVDEAVEAFPPIAAHEHRRDPSWRAGLAMLLDDPGVGLAPASALAAMARLRDRGSEGQEALADDFLRGSIAPADLGPSLYVVAALQVYFTRLAASLPAPSLRLLTQRGLCPCCGWTPVCGVITDGGQVPGARYLHCSLCATAWNHVRAVCITCGQSRSLTLRAIEGDRSAIRVETCDDCRTYAKMLYQAQDRSVDPVADDLATLGLDVLAGEQGWSRHAPNPLLWPG